MQYQTIKNSDLSVGAPEPLLIAATNLLTRLGYSYTLEETYDLLHDGDRLDWNRITEAGGIVIVDQGTTGFPASDNSLVRFWRSDSRDYECLVSSAQRMLSIDSLDGAVHASDYYGTVIGWITFNKEAQPPKEETGYQRNTVEGIEYKSLGSPKKMYVTKPEGIDLTDFSGKVATFRDFIGVPNTHIPYGTEVRVMGTAHYPVPPTGEDFCIPQSPINVWGEFTRIGHPAALHGYKRSDLSETKPAAIVSRPKVLAAIGAIGSTAPTPQIKPDTRYFNFQWLNDDHKPTKYRVMSRIDIRDYSENDATDKLLKGTNLDVYGSFTVNGKTLMLINRTGDTLLSHYWGVPEISNGQRIIEEIPDYTEIKQTVAEIEQEDEPASALSDNFWYHVSKLERKIIKRIESWIHLKK